MSEGEIEDGRALTLAEQVYGRLLDDIWEGRWSPGETVSAYALSRQLGVSRTPIVEALKRLEGDGLIEIVPRVGARLKLSGPGGSAELFAIVKALLGLAAERAAHRVNEAWLVRMDGCVVALTEASQRDDVPAFKRLAGEFCQEVIRAGLPAHAPAVEQFWRLMRAEASRDVGLVVRPETAAGARMVVDGMRRHSPPRARAAIERVVDALAAYVERRGGPDGPDSPPTHGPLDHAVLLYRSSSEFVASALPFALAGLQRDEPVLVVSAPDKLEVLGSALGPDGSRVEFWESGGWYDGPASVLRRYREYIEKWSARSRVRIIGEPNLEGRAPNEVEAWLRYESVLNVALESLPASILCPYDAEALPAPILEQARVVHPQICHAGVLSACPDYAEFLTPGAS